MAMADFPYTHMERRPGKRQRSGWDEAPPSLSPSLDNHPIMAMADFPYTHMERRPGKRQRSGWDEAPPASKVEPDSMITCLQTLFPNPKLGRCIYFSTVHRRSEDSRSSVSLYSIPYDFFGDGGDDDDDITSSNPDVEGVLACYESINFPTSCTLSSVGSSLFVVGGAKEFNPYGPDKMTSKIYSLGVTEPADGRHAVQMCALRVSPEPIAMDGKLYVFGCGPLPPFAEMFDPCSIPWTCVPLPPFPNLPTNHHFHLVTAALQSSKRILVASEDSASVYNVMDQVWEEFGQKVDFSNVQGQAAVLRKDTALCWISENAVLHTYDLVLKRWFEYPIARLDMREPQPDEPRFFCPLLPLDDNHLFCIWEEVMGFEGTILPLVRCTKIRVSMDTDAEGESRFSATAVASRSYVLLHPGELMVDAHVFLGEEDEGGERGSRLVVHDHGGRTSGHCGYGVGGRKVLSIAPFEICKRCTLPGHRERDCKGRPCARCRGRGYMAEGSPCAMCWATGHTAWD